MNKHIIGIDPGKSGGIATISTIIDDTNYMALKTPNSTGAMVEIVRVIKKNPISPVCYIENVHAFPTDARSSAFKFGVNYGIWQGILSSFGINMILVSPMKWQKHFGKMPKEKRERKNKLKAIASKRTGIKATLNTADAILIALYGYEQAESE